ncbi:MAG: hypothetical protein PHR06_04080, partial [Candidatus Cloacimonetes bacterium]|nr:hypothetical protein [Candidatus Cloacimonadota bacterium]
NKVMDIIPEYLTKFQDADMLIRFLSNEIRRNYNVFPEILELAKQSAINDEIYHLLLSEYYVIDNNELANSNFSKIDLDNDKSNFFIQKAAGINFFLTKSIESTLNILNKIDDPKIDSKIQMAVFLSQADSLETACEYFTEAFMSVSHFSEEEFLLFVGILDKTDEIELLSTVLDRAIADYPESIDLLNWYGYNIALYGGDYEKAETALLKAIEMSPEAYHIHDSLAWLYFVTDRIEESWEILRSIPIEYMTNSELLYHLALVSYHMNEKENAKIYFTEAIRINNPEKYAEKSKISIIELFNSGNNEQGTE